MPRESLKEATLSGIRWLMLTRVASEALALAAMVALARLVSPAAFGQAAVALIFLPLATILTFEGFASALVQREQVDAEHLRAATLMSFLGGALLSALALGLAPILWQPLFGADTAELMALASPIFVLAGIGGVPRALLWRRLDFRRMGLIDTASLMLGNALAVALALAGLQGRAIVWGALAQVSLNTLLLLAAAPPPRPRLHRQRAARDRRLRCARGAGGPRGRAVSQRRLRDPRGAPAGATDRHLLAGLQPRRGLPGQAERRDDAAGLPGVLAHGEPRAAARHARARDEGARGGDLPAAGAVDGGGAALDPLAAGGAVGGPR